MAARRSSFVKLRTGLGSTSLATDAGQALVSRQLYYPFGETRWTSVASLPTDFQFTGQRIQSTIALYDYHARFYDPYVGRFIQADTIVPSPGNPQHFNRYSYVSNNPLAFTDPSGHKDCGPACEGDDYIPELDDYYRFIIGGYDVLIAPIPEPVEILIEPEIPPAKGTWYGTLLRSFPRASAATEQVARLWPGVVVGKDLIYNSSIRLPGGSRYIQLHSHSVGQIRGGEAFWHINADVGPLARLTKRFDGHLPVPSLVGRLAKPATKALIVVSVAVDLYDLGTAVKADYDNAGGHLNFGPNSRHAVGRVAGGWGGALGGAGLGFAACGPVCALAGGFVGGFGGSAVGDWIAGFWD